MLEAKRLAACGLRFYQIAMRDNDPHLCRARHKRHRFAVQTLLNWYRRGLEIEPRLPTLSTYLGQVHVSDTYWYLSALPELMGHALDRLEKHWEGAR